MVKLDERLSLTFAALGDETRRGMLGRLGRGDATVSELAEPYGLTLAGALKHVRVLERAGLVVSHKQGRVRRCRLGTRALDEVAGWVERYRTWERRLDRLERLMEEGRT